MVDTKQRKVRYGIIGFGAFAERAIAPAIRASRNSELVAIQKRSAVAASKKAKEFDIPLAFDSAEELAGHQDVDAVFIVSANSQHCPETIAAAKEKKHVLVEKPMALSVAEASRMVKACRDHGVRLMVGHMIRFSPLVRRMKEVIESGIIGHVTFAKTEFIYDGRMSQRAWLHDMKIAGGGPLFDIGVHCLDTLRFLLGGEILSVKSHLEPAPTKTRTESTAEVLLKFSNKALASIYCSYAAPIRRSLIEIIGTEGTLSALDFTLGSRVIPLEIFTGAKGKSANTQRELIEVPNLYVEEITHFSKCILEGAIPSIAGEVGLENQRILDLALKGEKFKA
ncbi:MAG TPA: Gfo/Idh/MocA family oxidoreductase [Bacteroidota bacterium]